MKKFFSILLSFILVISLAVLTITISIGLPIYIRDFYFAFVKITDLPTISGYSFEVIETAFNELMDFLILNKEFSTGALKFSEEGKNHFIDVKFLFDLNFYGLIISLGVSLLIGILHKCKVIKIKRLFDLHPMFYSSILVILIPLVVGYFCLVDFDNAFTVFHHIFFPGKENWMFNPFEDEIINILPQEFFASCAALIGLSILVITFTSIITCLVKKHKKVIYFKKNI